MHHPPRTPLGILATMTMACGLWIAVPGPSWSHSVDCTGRSGIELARCERHQKMAAKCGPIQGEAHFACDREFLIGNPLNCKALAGDDARQCGVDLDAVKACQPRQGQEFMRCVRDATLATPAPSR